MILSDTNTVPVY